MSLDLSAKKQARIRVLIIAGSDPVGDWMASVLDLEQDMAFTGVVRDLSQALQSIKQLSPEVILVDVSSGILQRTDLLNRLSAPASGAAVIVVAQMSEVDMVRQAMLHGAQGFLLKPFRETELLSSIRQARDLLDQRQAELATIPRLPTGSAGELPTAEVISVFSPKGGVGCTTLAINLAVALKVTTGQPVILVDGDLRFGDIDAALNITSPTSISALLPNLDELDDNSLKQALVSHDSGIKVLIAPPHLDTADTIHPQQLRQLMSRLTKLSEGYIVVDTWSALDDCTLSFLDLSQHLVVVTTPQVTALRDAHRFLEVLKLLNYQPGKLMLVLNHCYQRSNLRQKDVERALGYPITQIIEYTPQQVTDSLNRGVPLLQAYQNSPAAKNILQLARQLSDKDAKEKQASSETEPTQAEQEETKRRGLLFQNRSASANRVGA